MLYCESCHAVFSDGRVCPLCHKRYIRDVRENDLCFFTEQPFLMASVVEDILKKERLNFVTRPVHGAGISAVTGAMLESIRFYTPYTEYAKACEFMETMFPDEEQEDCPEKQS